MAKAQVEIQFNWIYVAVVGAIILLVFLSIASGIRKQSKRGLEIDAINYFDEIFTSLQGSENTQHSITLPGIEIEFASGKDNCYEYSIKDSEFGRRSTEYVPIFSPETIKKKILSYSLGFDFPFRSSYMLYMTSPEIAYFFLDTEPKIQELYDDLPTHLTADILSSAGDFKDQNYYKIKIITFLEPEELEFHNSITRHKDVTLLKITPGQDLYGPGEITYYKKEGSGFQKESTYFVNKASLFGAIYSDNKDAYECNMGKVLIRLNKIASTLKKRVDLIKESDLPPTCASVVSLFDDAYSELTQLEDLTETVVFSKGLLDSLNVIQKKLTEINFKLTRASCITIY